MDDLASQFQKLLRPVERNLLRGRAQSSCGTTLRAVQPRRCRERTVEQIAAGTLLLSRVRQDRSSGMRDHDASFGYLSSTCSSRRYGCGQEEPRPARVARPESSKGVAVLPAASARPSK